MRQEFGRAQDWRGQQIDRMTNALASIRGGTSQQPNPNYTSGAQNAATYASIIASLWG
jgi:hypothetical protein